MSSLALVIEDDVMTAHLFGRMAAMAGLAAEYAYDGREGMARIRRDPVPDVIILDLHLPHVSGQEIFAATRAMGLASRIIVSTADTNLLKEFRGVADAIAAKPVMPSDMVALLKKMAGGRR